MNTNRFFYFLVLLSGVVLLVSSPGWSQPGSGPKGPVIANSFAVDRGYYGYIWKIYIEAEDEDGDMVKIACVADQIGAGRLPTSWIYLKKENRSHLKGYLQWNTFSSKTGDVKDGTQIVLRISILDKAGNESKEAVFPFTFVSGIGDPSPDKLSAPFDQGTIPSLGHINVNLVSPEKGIK